MITVRYAKCLQAWCPLPHARNVAQLAGRSFLPDSTSKNFPRYLREADEHFPHVFKLNIKTVAKPELSKFGQSFRPLLDRMVTKYGAIVLRGFNLDGAIPFSLFFSALGYKSMSYISGTGIKMEVAKGVAEPRSDPPVCTVEPHNEMSYLENYPHLLFLFCEVPPARSCGGESVLVDTRDLLHELDSSVVRKFQRLGVRYHHYLPGSNDDGKKFPSWQDVMQTESREEVEKHLKCMGQQYIRWDEDGSLTYWTTLPAMRPHPRTGELIWFNQAHCQHASHWRAHPKYFHYDLPDKRYPFTTLYGDGTQIETEVLQHIREATWNTALSTKLEKGDILVLDNMRVQHGRLGYTGKRKVLVSLARE